MKSLREKVYFILKAKKLAHQLQSKDLLFYQRLK